MAAFVASSLATKNLDPLDMVNLGSGAGLGGQRAPLGAKKRSGGGGGGGGGTLLGSVLGPAFASNAVAAKKDVRLSAVLSDKGELVLRPSSLLLQQRTFSTEQPMAIDFRSMVIQNEEGGSLQESTQGEEGFGEITRQL